MAFCCPKSIRACALRLTRLNASGVPLDPLTPNSRVQTSGFVELNLTPRYEGGDTEIVRDPGGDVRIVDTDFDVLLGMEVRLRLCAVNPVVLEMLTGLDLLSESASVLNDSRRFACQDPVMVEVWSKNVAADCGPAGPVPGSGLWVHWVLPRTNLWTLNGDIKFSSGVVEVSLSGYATANEGWFPSYPDPVNLFPSYVDGWPTGTPPATLPAEVVPDAWTVTEAQGVRNGGPLAWKCVNELPAPLSDCAYVGSEDCVNPDYAQSFVGPLGFPDSPPWQIPDPFSGPGGSLPQITPLGAVRSETIQTGAVPLDCCPDFFSRATIEGVVEIVDGEAPIFSTPVVLGRYVQGFFPAVADTGAAFFVANWVGAAPGTWTIAATVRDWTIGAEWQGVGTVASPLVPVNGDTYRLEVYSGEGTYLATSTYYSVVVLYLNNVEVGRVSFPHIANLALGFGRDARATDTPPCFPTAASGATVDTVNSFYVTVTDLGGGVYEQTLDDPNVTGILCDPGGPANNDSGAAGQCVLGGAPCVTVYPGDSATANELTFLCVPDASTRTVASWPNAITGGVYGPSGAGTYLTTTNDLSDYNLNRNAQNTGGYIIDYDLRAALAQWVTDFGSGVAVECKAVTPFPVECNTTIQTNGLDTNWLDPWWGVAIIPTELTPSPASPLLSFATDCTEPVAITIPPVILARVEPV